MSVEREYDPNTPQTSLGDSLYSLDINESVESKNVLLQGATLRTATAFGRSATVKAGEDIRPALNSLKSAGGGTLILLAGVHKVSYDIVLSDNISIIGESREETIIDFQGGSYSLVVSGVDRSDGGFVAVTNGSAAVVGTTTDFTVLQAGDYLLVESGECAHYWAEIASITDATHLTLSKVWPLASTGGTGASDGGFLAFRAIKNIRLENFTVRNSGSTTVSLLHLEYVLGLSVRNVLAEDGLDDGIDALILNNAVFESVECSRNAEQGWYINYCATVTYTNCSATANTLNGFFASPASPTQAFLNCTSVGNGDDGFYLSGAISNLIGCYASQNDGNGFALNGNGNDQGYLIACRSVFNGVDGFDVNTSTDSVVFVGCYAKDNTGSDWDVDSTSWSDPNIFVGCTSGTGAASSTTVAIAADNRDIMTANSGFSVIDEKHIYVMKNTSGGDMDRGKVVTYKAAAAGDEITTTTTVGDDLVFGISLNTSPNNEYGPYQVRGKTNVLKVNGTTDIAVGDFLCTYSEAGIAAKAGAGDMAFAIALEAYTTDDSNGVIDALLITPRKL